MNELIFILIGFFIVDNIFTYLNAFRYKKLYPEKDYTLIEINPIARTLWKKLGLLKGGILAVIIQFLILLIILFLLDNNLILIAIGMYLTIIIIHLDNSSLIKKKINEKNKIRNEKKLIRKIAEKVVIAFSILDLVLTFIYINIYHNWSPNVPFNLMEWNPLIVLLMNNLGLIAGLIIASILIISLMTFSVKRVHWLVLCLFLIAFVFAIINHIINFNLLFDFINKYPTGLTGFG